MSIPTFDQFIEPVLRFLAQHPEGVRAREAAEAAADALDLTQEQRELRVPSAVQYVYRNRAGWAHDRLKRRGLSESPQRGLWRLTPAGHEFARTHEKLSADEVQALATVERERRSTSTPESEGETASFAPAGPAAVESPDDRLEGALQELTASVADDLLEAILQNTPEFFEALVLDLLHALGYGTSRKDLERVGKAGDGGIDGIISLDRLGLEKVYVQAKRWQGSVGRPDVQAFYGALAGQRAKKGVFITTSAFTAQAIEFAKSVDVVLVDGARLTSLMIEHGVGVTHRMVKVPKLDSDYFEE